VPQEVLGEITPLPLLSGKYTIRLLSFFPHTNRLPHQACKHRTEGGEGFYKEEEDAGRQPHAPGGSRSPCLRPLPRQARKHHRLHFSLYFLSPTLMALVE
jgi:hypothetical protein